MNLFRTCLMASCALSLVVGAGASTAVAKPAPAKPAAASPVASLDVDIPYTKYVLKNGLTLIVHEDHKAPIVAVNIWYHVGSKNEPKGRSGFAHLFEHLMFNGSEHYDNDFFKVTEKLGATDMNGTTNTDRTNYFENVPKGSLDTVLWLEADRMGFLTGAISQAKLDEQRGVVQNEKRQGENQPYAISQDLIIRATWPQGHPYDHSVIGSMDDLNAAKLDDVKDWFRTWYGPSNATMVIAGDITPEEAKAKVEKYFGDIPPGPPVAHPQAWVPAIANDIRETAYDRVPQGRVYKIWNIPGDGVADADYLDLLSDVLSSDKTSRLYERLVYREQLATNVAAFANTSEIGGQFYIVATAKPGGDLDRIEAIINEEVSRLLTEGPTPAEMDKIRTARVASFVRGVERIGGFGGKSDQLAVSQVFHGSPDAWKESFNRTKTATGREVQGAGQRWLSKPTYTLQILPFPNYAAMPAQVDHAKMPEPTPTQAPGFPVVQRATLSNGLKVVLAERHDSPQVHFDLIVGGGFAGDPSAKLGEASLAMNMMDEGTKTRDALKISSDQTRLGAVISTGPASDVSIVSLGALKPTLDPSLDLYADVIMNPAFNQSDLDRLKKQQLAGIQQAKNNPNSMGTRVLPTLIFGAGHPYAGPSTGTEATVASLTRDDMVSYHQTWFHPNNATLVIVGDTTLAEITPKLEKAFGAWKPAPVKALVAPLVQPPAKQVVYLIDKPGAGQSIISASVIAPARSSPDQIAMDTMNTVLGGAFVSRLNMNLREDKHWSYGARSGFREFSNTRVFTASAPVQTDKTKESFVEMRKEFGSIVKDKAITADELAMAQANMTLRLPGRWETSDAVLNSIDDQVIYGLPEDYWTTYADRVRGLSLADVNGVAGRVVLNDSLTWVVVGDRAKIEKGLRELGLEVRVIDTDGHPVP